MSFQRPTFDPQGGYAVPVDKLLGNAYPVVKEVYNHLAEIDYLAHNIDGLIVDIHTSRDDAALSAAAAQASAEEAAASVALVDADRLAAQEAAESAQENANLAEASRINAEEAELSAQAWAALTGAPVQGGNYSAKQYALDAGVSADAAAASAAEAQAAVPTVQVADYALLRAYTGNATRVDVTGYLISAAPSGIAGMFIRDDVDTTTADDGGTVIVVTSGPNTGKRFKRANAQVFDVTWFGAKLDAATNDTAAVNAALLSASLRGVGEVRFRGTLGILTGILARSGVTLKGYGWKASCIKTLTGFTGNVYETYDFAAVQAAQPADTSVGAPHSYGIEDCSIDALTYSGAVTATTGYGVRLYGRQLRLRNLLIAVKGIGYYTEFPAIPSYVSYDTVSDTKFSVIENIEVTESGYEGFVFNGPTDQRLDNIFVGFPAGSRNDVYDTTGPKTSLLFPGEPIHGVRILRSVELGFLHAYDNEYGYAIYVKRQAGDPTIRLRGEYIMGESSYGGVYIDTNVRYQISLLETHANKRGPTTGGAYAGSAGANPHVKIDSTAGGGISKLDIYRQNNEQGSSGLVLGGLEHDITCQVFGYDASYTGGGKGVVNAASSSKIKAQIVSKNDANRMTVGFEEASTTSANDLDIYAKFCATNIDLLGGAGADVGNRYRLYSERAGTTGINNVARLAAIPYLEAELYEYDGTNRKRNKWMGSVAVNFATTGLQTLSIPYGSALIRDPLESEIQVTVSYDTGTFSPIPRFGVSNIDTVNKEIDLFIECTGGAAGTGKLNVRVG